MYKYILIINPKGTLAVQAMDSTSKPWTDSTEALQSSFNDTRLSLKTASNQYRWKEIGLLVVPVLLNQGLAAVWTELYVLHKDINEFFLV